MFSHESYLFETGKLKPSLEREIGVYWYLFSNHRTRKCIYKSLRVIISKGEALLWYLRASCRLPPHGVPMPWRLGKAPTQLPVA